MVLLTAMLHKCSMLHLRRALPPCPAPWGQCARSRCPPQTVRFVTGSLVLEEPPAPSQNPDAPWQLPVNIQGEAQTPWKNLCISILQGAPAPSLPSQEITPNHIREISRSPAQILTFIRGLGTSLAAGFESHGHAGTNTEMFPAHLFIPSAHQGQHPTHQRCVTFTLSWEEIRTRLAWVVVPGCTVVARDAGVPSSALILQSLRRSQCGSGSELAAGCYAGARWWMRLKEFDFQIIHKPG